MKRISMNTLVSAGLMLCAVSVAGASPRRHATKAAYSHASIKHSSSMRHTAAHHESATVTMPSERATQIQSALIQRGYLTGEPTGAWDGQTVAAMQRMQADNGWQSKVTPDSRALIKLGLGPQSSESSLNQMNIAKQTPPQ